MSERTRPAPNRTEPTRPGPKRIVDLLGGARKWQTTLDQILDQEFIVTSIDPTRHASKDVAIGDVTTKDGPTVVLFNSTVIAKTLLEHKADLPLLCKVVRMGRRYHFSV